MAIFITERAGLCSQQKRTTIQNVEMLLIELTLCDTTLVRCYTVPLAVVISSNNMQTIGLANNEIECFLRILYWRRNNIKPAVLSLNTNNSAGKQQPILPLVQLRSQCTRKRGRPYYVSLAINLFI